VCVAGDPSLTRAIPERFKDDYRTRYKALHKCLVLIFILFGTIVGDIFMRHPAPDILTLESPMPRNRYLATGIYYEIYK